MELLAIYILLEKEKIAIAEEAKNMKTIIYLIRHSETLKTNNVEFELLDKLDDTKQSQIKNEKIPLSQKGEEKAEKLSNMQELKRIDKIYSSNYERAIQTARYISEKNNLEIKIEKRLGERKLGDLNTLEELGKNKKHDYTTEQLLNENLKNKDGESAKEVRKRMIEAIKEILEKYEGKKIVVVSHGAAIKYFLKQYCKYDYENKIICYRDKKVCNMKLEAPCVLKMEYEGKVLVAIEKVT